MNANRQTQQSDQLVKSQNGGSTNLSEGSNQIDEEFKIKKGEKFEFINEKVNAWPQWSVDQNEKEINMQLQLDQAAKQAKIKEIYDDLKEHQFMYCRSMSYPIKSISESEPQKESVLKGIAKRIKGFFK